jgi:hypothetical protein
MNLRVILEGEVSPHDAAELAELAAEMRLAGISVAEVKSPSQPGTKDGGLVIALAAGGLTVALVRTGIAIVAYWQSSRPKFSLSLTQDGVGVTVGNLSAKQLEELSPKLELDPHAKELIVKVSRT